MIEPTLMTQPLQNAEGAAPSDTPTDTPATVAGEGGQPTASGTAPEAAGGTSAPAQNADPKAGAPETYDFKTPDGAEIDPQVLGAFGEVAKELDLPQDAAQKVLDKMGPVLQARHDEQLSAVRQEWASATKADKEIGGDKLGENLAYAKQARDAFTTPEFRDLLEKSGLGNHPEVIRVFVKVGKAISEDGFVVGGGKATSADARRLYSASNMNP